MMHLAILPQTAALAQVLSHLSHYGAPTCQKFPLILLRRQCCQEQQTKKFIG